MEVGVWAAIYTNNIVCVYVCMYVCMYVCETSDDKQEGSVFFINLVIVEFADRSNHRLHRRLRTYMYVCMYVCIICMYNMYVPG